MQTSLSVLLMGPPGGGKTTFALQWPGLWVADADRNLAGPMRFLERKLGHVPSFKLSEIQFDDGGNPVPFEKQWPRLKDEAELAIKDPEVKTIFIDSLTHVDRIVYRYACDKQHIQELEFQQWNLFKNELYRFIMSIRDSGKTLLFSCHENIEYDKKGYVEKYVPTLSTNLKNYVGYMFTDIWKCEIVPDAGGKVKAIVKVHPNATNNLKNSLLFDKQIEATYEAVAKALAK